MWKDILNFVLDLVSKLGEFGTWLFTPINMNVINLIAGDVLEPTELNSIGEDMVALNQSGLSNVGFNFIWKDFGSLAEPIYVAPVYVLSIGFLTIMFAIYMVKFVFK